MSKKLEKKITKTHKKLHKSRQKVIALRRQRKPDKVEDYIFTGTGGDKVTLSSLFGKKDELLVVHNMGASCPYCTLWADGFNGFVPHLEDRAGFVVISEDSPATQKKFADSRGWKFKMVSSKDTKFHEDMGYKQKKHGVMPGLSAFSKDKKGRIYHLAHEPLGPGDFFCSIWHMFDLLPEREWEPKFSY